MTVPGVEGDDAASKPGLVPVSYRRLADLQVSPENDQLYKPVNPEDPEVIALAQSIREFGVKEPFVITRDDYIISGHRRRVACQLAGVEIVPTREEDLCHSDEGFLALLREYNRQRIKSADELIREEIVSSNPEEAYARLKDRRIKKSRIKADVLVLGQAKRRHGISASKAQFRAAVRRIVYDLEDYWPLSDRKVHYELLNDPPLRHLKKPEEYFDHKGILRYNRYRNDKDSYKAACDLLTRLRLIGGIPFDAIGDETRPVTIWDVDPSVAPYIRKELKNFLSTYWRDLLQSQPNHIEIIGEKLTVEGIIRPVALRYLIPYTIGRGYSSLPPRKALFDRYTKSGKAKLILLFFCDHDPEGWDIAESFSKSMRDDFGIAKIEAIKVALKPEQVTALGLPENTAAKTGSSRYKKFKAKFGPAAYELEAVPAATLQQWLDEAVRSVLDIKAFNDEVAKEKQEEAGLDKIRIQLAIQLKTILPDLAQDDDDDDQNGD
jgi:ParB-like chromosome segregation protein Spo0J